MTDTTESQARAIAEALGWKKLRNTFNLPFWHHPVHKKTGDVACPRITDDTTVGRAMCYDAIVWLSVRADLAIIRRGPMHRIVVGDGSTDAHDAMTFPAAIEAAMIKELGL